MVKYKIKEDTKNPVTTVLEMTGEKREITLGDYEWNIKANEKSVIEIEAQIKLEKAKITNVLRTNPEVETTDKKIRIACYIYERATSVVEVGNQKLEQLIKRIEEDKESVLEISKQTGLTSTK